MLETHYFFPTLKRRFFGLVRTGIWLGPLAGTRTLGKLHETPAAHADHGTAPLRQPPCDGRRPRRRPRQARTQGVLGDSSSFPVGVLGPSGSEPACRNSRTADWPY